MMTMLDLVNQNDVQSQTLDWVLIIYQIDKLTSQTQSPEHLQQFTFHS